MLGVAEVRRESSTFGVLSHSAYNTELELEASFVPI